MSETKSTTHEVIIIGAGPAAYTASLYCARNNLNPVLFCGTNPGGQLLTTTDIENYPGLDGINGFELVDNMRKQAVKYGTAVYEDNAIDIDQTEKGFTVYTDSQDKENSVHYAIAVIIATGANPNKLSVPGADKLWNKGISSCAVCDGALPRFRNKVIIVVGGGDSAMEEASFLSKYGSKVIIIHRKDTFRASKVMQERVLKNPKIEIMFNHEIVSINGEDSVESATVYNNVSKTTQTIECGGLFYAIGHVPNTQFIKASKLNVGDTPIKLDSEGYVVIDNTIAPTSTSVKGIFVAGDVADKRYRQAITASGTGCMSALDVSAYLDSNV